MNYQFRFQYGDLVHTVKPSLFDGLYRVLDRHILVDAEKGSTEVYTVQDMNPPGLEFVFNGDMLMAIL